MTLGSFRKFQADDYLMLLALCFYTTLISTINIVRYTNSNLLPPGFNINTITPHDKAQREYGSKLILVVEQCQCATVWLVKGCLVLLYLRLTSVHRENILIKILGAYVVITFVVMDILYFGVWCQPFHEYWAVPTDSSQCDAATNHLITNACFNLSSDVAMILIVLPIFLRMRLPWQKKIPLIFVFSLGLFTILAAILNKVYSFSDPFGSLWTYWYTRESSTALLVANLPFVFTLWIKIPGLRKLIGYSKTRSRKTGFDDTGPSAVKSPKASQAGIDDWMMEDGTEERMKESGDMTFAEMLSERNPAAMDSKEPTPITHPGLFYSKKQATFAEDDIDDEIKMVHHSISKEDGRPASSTLQSSDYTSGRSNTSAGS